MAKVFTTVVLIVAFLLAPFAQAAKVTIQLGNYEGVTFVGAIQRWDADGNHKKLPDSKAKIDSPAVDATATDEGRGRWVFKKLPAGTYDLVILADGFRRFEGFQYVPVHEFDPFLSSDMGIAEETEDLVLDDIKKSPQYENVVKPLYMVGNKKVVRVFMMLLRDKPTTFTDIPNAVTLRHEIWQYSWNYGGWQKDKRTKVFDRIIMNGNDLRKWTWLWDPKLGGVEVGASPMLVKYQLPKASAKEKLKGLYPY